MASCKNDGSLQLASAANVFPNPGLQRVVTDAGPVVHCRKKLPLLPDHLLRFLFGRDSLLPRPLGLHRSRQQELENQTSLVAGARDDAPSSWASNLGEGKGRHPSAPPHPPPEPAGRNQCKSLHNREAATKNASRALRARLGRFAAAPAAAGAAWST